MPRFIKMLFTEATTEAKSWGWTFGLRVASQRQNDPAAMAARGQIVAVTDSLKPRSCAGEGSKQGARPFRPGKYWSLPADHNAVLNASEKRCKQRRQAERDTAFVIALTHTRFAAEKEALVARVQCTR